MQLPWDMRSCFDGVPGEPQPVPASYAKASPHSLLLSLSEAGVILGVRWRTEHVLGVDYT